MSQPPPNNTASDAKLATEIDWPGAEEPDEESDNAPEPGIDADAVTSVTDVLGDSALPGDDLDTDRSLDENIVHELVRYIRSNTIRNEQQAILLGLSFASGLSDDPGEYLSTATIGTSSGGKTHLKDRIAKLYRHIRLMDASTGTDKVLFYSDDWDNADIINMGELQQPSTEMLEFMKRAHGGDGEVVLRSTRGNPSSGFEEEVIRKEPKSYHFTYAQFDADYEFWNRLLKIPVHESESKNRAVGRLAWGHVDIDMGDGVEYGGYYNALPQLQSHILDVSRNAPGRVVVPSGGDEFAFDAWEIIEPIFRHGRSEVNRIYSMVRNLVKASARLNFRHRETVVGDGERVTIAGAQDLANVLRCLDVLRATTHEIGPRKRSVVEAIKAVGDDDGAVDGLEPIIDYLEESDASKVRLDELENILDDLEQDYLIARDGDTVQARNWDALGEPRVEAHSDVFADCTDPMTGEPFLDAWADYREQRLTANGPDDDETTITSVNHSLHLVDVDELEAASTLDGWQAHIASTIGAVLDGRRVADADELSVEAYLGLADPGDCLADVETEGTLLDPDHDVWDVDDKPDDWVSSEADARLRCQTVIRTLLAGDHIYAVEVHDDTADGTQELTLAVDLTDI